MLLYLKCLEQFLEHNQGHINVSCYCNCNVVFIRTEQYLTLGKNLVSVNCFKDHSYNHAPKSLSKGKLILEREFTASLILNYNQYLAKSSK